MKLSVTSWSFPQCSFEEAVGLSSLLNINAIEFKNINPINKRPKVEECCLILLPKKINIIKKI